MARSLRATATIAIVTWGLIVGPGARVGHAQTQPGETAESRTKEAEQLFDEGVTLVAKNDYAAACPKFERSQELDPALGTEFNLADCKERAGKLATALRHFEKVARIAHESGKSERERTANERMAALRRKVPTIAVRLAADVPTGLAVTLDGERVGPPLHETLYVDAGDHRVRVTAPKHEPFEVYVDARDGENRDVLVPALVRSPDAPASAPPPPPPPASSKRTVALALGIGGIVGLGVGGAFGIAALAKRDEAIDACGSSEPKSCAVGPGDPASKWDEAHTAGNISTVGFILGGVLVAAGVVLYLVAAPERAPAARASAVVRPIRFDPVRGAFAF